MGHGRSGSTGSEVGRRTRLFLEQPREVTRPVPQAEPQAEGHERRQDERDHPEHPQVASGAAHAVAP